MEKNTKTIEQLEQELLEAKALIGELKPDVQAKKKPYTRAEIKDIEAKGHVIGAPHQKLSEGHNEEDLHKWDMWQCELGLKDIGKLPEIGEAISVPDYIIPMKIVKKGMIGNDISFQSENNMIDFRFRGPNNQIFFKMPSGTVEASKRYECHYFVKVETPRGATMGKKIVCMVVKDFPIITGAPVNQNLWGKG